MNDGKVLVAKPEHVELMELRPEEADEFALDPEGSAKVRGMVDTCVAGTLVYEGRILCMMGYWELWPGVLEVWVLPSIYAAKHPKPFLRTIKRYMERLEIDHKPHRIQSPALDNELHDRWMVFLGFKKERIMKKYSSTKKDYAMWAIVEED